MLYFGKWLSVIFLCCCLFAFIPVASAWKCSGVIVNQSSQKVTLTITKLEGGNYGGSIFYTGGQNTGGAACSAIGNNYAKPLTCTFPRLSGSQGPKVYYEITSDAPAGAVDAYLQASTTTGSSNKVLFSCYSGMSKTCSKSAGICMVSNDNSNVIICDDSHSGDCN